MRKLKLDLDQLVVDSFSTQVRPKRGGTVHGQVCTCYTQCDTCPGCPTCDASCNGTCGGATCAGTCGGGTCGGATCAGSCDASCGGTCGATCYDCTVYDITCNNIGTCNWAAGICYLEGNTSVC